MPNVALTRALLGPSLASQLRQRRAVAVDDAAATLRRIERDLHDGTQAQLVTLAMQLGLAKDELAGGDAPAAVALIDTAHQGAKQALIELRDLARGLHPPVLDDGLTPPLESLAARSAVPVALSIDLPERPSPAIESIVYFSAAELLTNLAKHSQARHATVTLTHRRHGWLRLTVSDDGIGGDLAHRRVLLHPHDETGYIHVPGRAQVRPVLIGGCNGRTADRGCTRSR